MSAGEMMTSLPPFEVVMVAGEPVIVPAWGVRVIDQHEWLQLTIGHFLAPAAATDRTEEVQYLLHGRRPAGRRSMSGDIRGQVRALRQAVRGLREHLREQIACPRLSRSQVLASLSVLLELRLPAARDREACHLRDGLLQLTGWGLRDGVRLGDLLAPDGSDVLDAYLDDLEDTLRCKYLGGDRREPTDAPRDTSDLQFSAPPTLTVAGPPKERILVRTLAVLVVLVVVALAAYAAFLLMAKR